MAENLDELLKVIKGDRGVGPGIRTYPTEPDNNQKKLHEACVELERQGLIYRAREEEGWILWKAKA